MSSSSIASPEDQSATFIELFFDLVFVFSVTQVVALLHHGLTLETVGQAVLVFWLVWWAWTQFTWALNAADTTHQWVELGTLAATAVAFFMAVAVPEAFHDRALLFAVAYIIVRVIGLTLYVWVSRVDADLWAALRVFSILSIGGLVTVLIGALVGGPLQYVFWTLTIVLDVVAAAIGGQSDNWNLHPEHFAERHGLFVIIALGETLIVAAGGVAGAELTGDLVLIALLAVGITFGFWWTYFVRAKPVLDHALEAKHGAQQSSLARDSHSLTHFPMVCGVIAFAVAIEEAIAHPADPLHLEVQVALALGVMLFVGGMAVALWRATGRLPLPRLGIAIITGVFIVVIAGTTPVISLAIALVGTVIVAVIEQRQRAPLIHPD